MIAELADAFVGTNSTASVGITFSSEEYIVSFMSVIQFAEEIPSKFRLIRAVSPSAREICQVTEDPHSR